MMTIEHEAFKAAGTNTDDADDRTVLLAILGCAQSWSGEVRILGNVRASDAFRAVRNAIAQLSTSEIAEMAENERLREALELIADIDVKPFRCAVIARAALAAEDRT